MRINIIIALLLLSVVSSGQVAKRLLFNTTPIVTPPTVTYSSTSNVSSSSADISFTFNANGNTINNSGVRYSLTTPVLGGSNEFTEDITSPATANLIGLLSNTTYYFKCFVDYGISQREYDTEYSFTTSTASVLPTVVIGNITLGDSYCFMDVDGTVTSEGSAPVTERGTVWSVSSFPTTSDNKITAGSGIGSFNTEGSSFPSGTTVYFRTYAISSIGTAYSSSSSQLNIEDITASASDAYSITSSTASVDLDLTYNGNTVTVRTLKYRLEGSTGSYTYIVGGAGNDDYTFELSGLMSATEYEYIINYATDCSSYNTAEKTFITSIDATVPTVDIGTVTVGASYCLISVAGDVTDGGTSTVTARGTVWSITTANPTLSDNIIPTGSGTGTFTSSSSDMPAGETVYFRNYATNTTGTSYSSTVSQVTYDDATGLAGDAYSITANTASVDLDLYSNSNTVTVRTLYYRVSGSVSAYSTVIGGAGNTDYTFNITGLTSTTTYEYYIGYETACSVNNTTTKYFSTIGATPPIYESRGGIGTTTSALTFAVPYPTTVVAGDFLVMIAAIAEFGEYNTPSGWTFEGRWQSDDLSYGAYSKTASGTEGGTSIIIEGQTTANKSAIIFRMSNVGIDDIDTYTPFLSSGVLNFPYSGVANSTFGSVYVIRNNTSVSHTGTGWDEEFDISTSSGGGWTYCFVNYTFESAGSSSTLQSTWSSSYAGTIKLTLESDE